jgi:hypothetical protein
LHTKPILLFKFNFAVLLKKRLTISIDEKTIAKLRKIQSELIQDEARNVPFSEVIESALEKGLKK